MEKVRYCAQCRSGEKRVPADVLVKGQVVFIDRPVPYQAWLCNDHFEMLVEDGNELKVIDRSPEEWARWADETTREYTAYGSFRELCRSNATVVGFPGALRLWSMVLEYRRLNFRLFVRRDRDFRWVEVNPDEVQRKLGTISVKGSIATLGFCVPGATYAWRDPETMEEK